LAERTYAVPGLADSVLARSPPRNVRPKSADLVALLQTGALDYALVYQSSARNAGLRWLELPAAMNLGDDSSAAIYATASVRIPGRTRGDTVVVTGTPIRYALSIPVAAENATSAEALVVFLITRRGRAILRASGLDVDVAPLVVGEGAPREVRDALVARTVRADTAH
ncbi:MAG TPA: substrate-binding domain-containing protein, partial [Gemmatimonadaceae bacterium]|nr:substrate-binding domain-containing protein [Gemmatimonadaceae bacterium]